MSTRRSAPHSEQRPHDITAAPRPGRSGVTPSPPPPAEDTDPLAEARPGFFRSWAAFWFTPVRPAGLHLVRVLSGLLFLFWLLSLAGHQEAFFGLRGWFDTQAYREAARLPGGPPVPIDSWSVLYLFGNNAALVNAFYWTSVGVLVLFTLGVAVRLTAVFTWIIVASFVANPVLHYGADYLLVILASYLMLGYLLYGQWGREQSLLARLAGPRDAWLFAHRGGAPRHSYAANLALRLLQVHFAIVVVASALHKLQFAPWWSGVGFWGPLHPPFETTVEQLRSEQARADSYLFWMSLGQYLAVAWQLAFPVFAWRKNWRWLVVGGGIVAWAGCAFLYRQPLYGPVYFIACLSFVTAEEWRGVGGWLGWVGAGLPRPYPRARPRPARLAARS